MRDDHKTLMEGSPEPAQTDKSAVTDAFRSTFRSGTVPPPPEDGADDTPTQSGMRRLDLVNLSSKSTLLSQNAPPVPPETLRSSPAGMAQEPENDGDILHVPSGQPPSDRYEHLSGRTLHGLPKSMPPKRGPQTRGADVRAERVRSIGEVVDDIRDTDSGRPFRGRVTDPDPHNPGRSVRAEPIKKGDVSPARPARGALSQDTERPPAPRPATGERPSLVILARNQLLNRVLWGALGLAGFVVLGSEIGILDFNGDGASEAPTAAAEVPPEAPSVGVSAAPGPESASEQIGPTTTLDTVPPGAEIVWHGAVIANTPAAVPRDRQDGDYLLRKQGYETQLVRIDGRSPESIRLELKPIGRVGANAETGQAGPAAETGTVPEPTNRK